MCCMTGSAIRSIVPARCSGGWWRRGNSAARAAAVSTNTRRSRKGLFGEVPTAGGHLSRFLFEPDVQPMPAGRRDAGWCVRQHVTIAEFCERVRERRPDVAIGIRKQHSATSFRSQVFEKLPCFLYRRRILVNDDPAAADAYKRPALG